MTNKTYIKQRDLLIPEAERFTNEKFGIGKVPLQNQRGFRWGKTPIDMKIPWTRCFLGEMNRLAIAEGLCEEGSV